jgi:hypothetical protein
MPGNGDHRRQIAADSATSEIESQELLYQLLANTKIAQLRHFRNIRQKRSRNYWLESPFVAHEGVSG